MQMWLFIRKTIGLWQLWTSMAIGVYGDLKGHNRSPRESCSKFICSAQERCTLGDWQGGLPMLIPTMMAGIKCYGLGNLRTLLTDFWYVIGKLPQSTIRLAN